MTEIEAIQNLENLFSQYELTLPHTDSLETLQFAIKALEKQIPKKPEKSSFHWGGKVWECPVCESIVHKSEEYCSACGQKLDWSECNE